MTTAEQSPNDSGRGQTENSSDIGVSKVGQASPQRLSGIREQSPATAQHGSDSRPASSSASHESGSDHGGKLVEAMNYLCDSIDTIVREAPRGAQAQFSSVKEKVSKARESLSSCCGSSKSDSKNVVHADGASKSAPRSDGGNKNAPRTDGDAKSVARAEGEGMSANKGQQAPRA